MIQLANSLFGPMDQQFANIIHATYQLLEFFPDNEPLKNKAKDKTLAILDCLVTLENGHGEKEKTRAQLLADMDILEQYLELGRRQRWLGGFNFLILLKEYRALRERMGSNVALIESRAPKNIENAPGAGPGNNDSPPVTARQGRILKILEKEGQAQVSDFLKAIPSVTKRTLRRDLDDLLKKGKVERIGEWNQTLYKLGQDRTKNGSFMS